MEIKLNIIKDIKLKNPILIQGFPGSGLVGTICALYLVEKLHLEQIGYIYSDKFPPIAAVHHGIPYFPARIYASKKYNLIVLFSEFIIPSNLLFNLANEIYNFAKQKKVKKIICLGSILKKEQIDYSLIYAVVSLKNSISDLEKHNIHVIKEGLTTGLSSILLSYGAIDNFEVISLLSLSSDSAVDLMSSYKLLLTLKNYLNLDLDLSEMENDAKKMEQEMQKLITQAKKTKDNTAAAQEDISMYQ
jgi:uncharacterized protein